MQISKTWSVSESGVRARVRASVRRRMGEKNRKTCQMVEERQKHPDLTITILLCKH